MFDEVIRRVALAFLVRRNNTIGFWDMKYISLAAYSRHERPHRPNTANATRSGATPQHGTVACRAIPAWPTWIRRFPVSAGSWVVFIQLACNPAFRAENVRIIPEAEWIEALGPFSAAVVRVNNYSPTPMPGQPAVSAFHVADDSQISLAGGVSVPFDIPLIRQDPYSIYISDMNSTSIGIDAFSGAASVLVSFEEEGQEIIGNCVENAACVCGDPRIDLDGAELVLRLPVEAAGGRLVLTDISAEFRSTFDETGPCRDNLCAFLCDIIRPNRENRTREAIQNAAVAFFQMNRGLIEGLLNDRIMELGVTRPITSAVISGRGDLILTLQPE